MNFEQEVCERDASVLRKNKFSEDIVIVRQSNSRFDLSSDDDDNYSDDSFNSDMEAYNTKPTIAEEGFASERNQFSSNTTELV